MDKLDKYLKQLANEDREIVPEYVENRIDLTLRNLPDKVCLSEAEKSTDSLIDYSKLKYSNRAKKTNKKLSPIFSILGEGIGAVIFILVLVLVPITVKHFASNNQSSINSNIQANHKIELQTFSSTKYGFSVSYPKTWSGVDGGSWLTIKIDDSKKNVIFINGTSYKNYVLDQGETEQNIKTEDGTNGVIYINELNGTIMLNAIIGDKTERGPGIYLKISKADYEKNKDNIMNLIKSIKILSVEDNSGTDKNKSNLDNKNTNTQIPSNNISVLDAYKAVLQNKSEFYNTNAKKNQNFNDFLVNNGVYETVLDILHFTVLDMDEDKIPEVVVELTACDGEGYADYYEVLHYMDGKVYGYFFVVRAFSALKADGTVYYTNSAADGGYVKLRFQASESEKDILGYTKEDLSTDPATVKYFIDNKPVTEDKFNTFMKEQDSKKDATWYDFYQNNIDEELANKKINYSEDLCTDNEEVLYSFKVENSSKVLSLCVSKTQPDYIVYRFGTKDNIELEHHDNSDKSWGKFTYSHPSDGSSDNYFLTFYNDAYCYKIYEKYNSTNDGGISAGVIITNTITSKQTVITGIPSSIKGTLKNLGDTEKVKIDNSLK